VPERDVETLRALGIAAVFPTSTPLDDLVAGVRSAIEARRGEAANERSS
jgi:hypothetical protein